MPGTERRLARRPALRRHGEAELQLQQRPRGWAQSGHPHTDPGQSLPAVASGRAERFLPPAAPPPPSPPPSPPALKRSWKERNSPSSHQLPTIVKILMSDTRHAKPQRNPCPDTAEGRELGRGMTTSASPYANVHVYLSCPRGNMS